MRAWVAGLILVVGVAGLSSGCVSRKTHRAAVLSVEESASVDRVEAELLRRRLTESLNLCLDDRSAKTERLRVFNQVNANGDLYPLRAPFVKEREVDGSESWQK